MDLAYQAALLGTWFGLLHAFDADHLATIGGLAVNNRSLQPTSYALRWALGHSAALATIVAVVLGLGLAGVVEWLRYAEFLVCLALLVIGTQALRAVWRRLRTDTRARAGVERTAIEHRHAGPHAHVHFFSPFHAHMRSGTTSVLMGVIHGGAGSAAVLALLPLAHFRGGLAGAVYLLCFSVGVALGALAFARVFALCAARSASAGERIGAAFQTAVGALALASGALLLFEIAHGSG